MCVYINNFLKIIQNVLIIFVASCIPLLIYFQLSSTDFSVISSSILLSTASWNARQCHDSFNFSTCHMFLTVFFKLIGKEQKVIYTKRVDKCRCTAFPTVQIQPNFSTIMISYKNGIKGTNTVTLGQSFFFSFRNILMDVQKNVYLLHK